MSGYTIVVFGATGFTGALVAEYLAETTRDSNDEKIKGLTWAISGRNQTRLEEIKQNVKKINPKANPGVIVADSADQASIDNMVKQAKIIICTAGPFYRYSIPVVDACVRFKVHYVDITGEAHFIRKIASTYHEDAAKNGTFIVPSCGFDSVPSDLTAFLIVDQVQKKFNSKTSKVVNYATNMSGGFSGGTFNTILDAFQVRSERKPGNAPRKPVAGNSADNYKQLDFMGFGYDAVAGLWTSPFVMSAINAKAVRKSNELLNQAYGSKFTYQEGMGSKSMWTALGVTAFMLTFAILVLLKPVRYLMGRFGPQPGTGPSKEQREKGFFKMSAYGISEKNPKDIVRASVVGKYDPGYKCTSQMVTESAFCILFDLLSDDKKPFSGGVLTPASAMGHRLADRLRTRLGMRFDVE